MPPAVERRIVILAEGNFGFHHGKTAMGVIRFGHDTVMAVIDSTQAGRNVREWLGDSGRNDIPIVATLNDALGRCRGRTACSSGSRRPAASCPTSGEGSSSRRSAPGSTSSRASTRSSATTPSFAEAARSSGVRLIDFRRPPERMDTAVGRRHLPDKRVILTVGTDCAIGKMSVAFELRRAGAAAGRSTAFVATGQTGMMIEGWGVAVDRVAADFLQGTVEWLVEDAEGRGRLGDRRGPGVARPSRVQQRHRRPHPRGDATRDGHGPQAGHGRPRLRAPVGRPVPDRRAAPVHRRARNGRRAGRAVAGRRRGTQHVTHRTTIPRRAGSSRRPRSRRVSRATTRSASAASRCGPRSRRRSTACRGSTLDEPDEPREGATR